MYIWNSMSSSMVLFCPFPGVLIIYPGEIRAPESSCVSVNKLMFKLIPTRRCPNTPPKSLTMMDFLIWDLVRWQHWQLLPSVFLVTWLSNLASDQDGQLSWHAEVGDKYLTFCQETKIKRTQILTSYIKGGGSVCSI